MKPLEDKTGPFAKMFSVADLSTLFSNIAMIEVMCKDLLRLFEQAASEAPRPADAAVGKAYIAKKIALTASFSAYCANQSKALQLFDTMKKKNASFNAYLQSIRDHPSLRGLGLLDWLIKPVQRVTKYPLLLRELEKHTPLNHSDRENTVLAAKAVQELVDQVNIAAKTTESFHHMIRIADEVGDIPSSLQLKSTPGRYFVTEAKFVKVSHGKHQERFFWLFSDLIMYARPNVTPLKKYTYKGTIILSKSNYEDLPEPNEFGANAIRITRLDSKKTYIIYCKETKQKVFWLTNINELKDLGSKGTLGHSMPTIGVAKIVSDSNPSAAPVDFATKTSADNDKTNNSLVMWSVAVRIAGWTNAEDSQRILIHECAVKCKPFGKDVDYCFMFSDGWMGTKIKMFKTAQSSKNAVDFKVFIPYELMESFSPRSDTAVEVRFVDPDGGSKNGAFIIEYDTSLLQKEAIKLMPIDQIGKVRESLYTKRISHQSDSSSSNPITPTMTSSPIPTVPMIARSQTSASLSLSTPSLPTMTSSSSIKTPGPPIPAGYGSNSIHTSTSPPGTSSAFSSLSYGGPNSSSSSSSGAPLSQPVQSMQGRTMTHAPPNAHIAKNAFPTTTTTISPLLSSSAPQQNSNFKAATSGSMVVSGTGSTPGPGIPKQQQQAPLINTPGARKTSPKPMTQNLSIGNNHTAATATGNSTITTNESSSSSSQPSTQPSTPNGSSFTMAHQSIPPTAAATATSSGSPKVNGTSSFSTPPKKGPGPPMPKTPINVTTTSPANPPKASVTNGPASMPAKTLHSHQVNAASSSSPGIPKASPKTPIAGVKSAPPLVTPYEGGGSTPSTPTNGGNVKLAPKTAAAVVAVTPPMPTVPKYVAPINTTAPPPKGPGKLAGGAAKKWPPN
jgi:hypothetical protein